MKDIYKEVHNMKKGKVYIAGAGPGDENLISVRAMELVKKADVIVYDRLAAERFLQYADRKCEKINAGKGKRGKKGITFEGRRPFFIWQRRRGM